jgi:hypothetical protein
MAAPPAAPCRLACFSAYTRHLPVELSPSSSRPLFPLGSYIIGDGKSISMTDRNGRASKQAKQVASLRRTVIEASHHSEPTGQRRLDNSVGLSGQNRLNVGRTRMLVVVGHKPSETCGSQSLDDQLQQHLTEIECSTG